MLATGAAATTTIAIPILLCLTAVATVGIAGLGIHYKTKDLTRSQIVAKALAKANQISTRTLPFLNPFSYDLKGFTNYNPFKKPPSRTSRILKAALHLVKFGVACITMYLQLSLTAFALLLNSAPALLSIIVTLVSALFLYVVVPLLTNASKKVTFSIIGFVSLFLFISITLGIYLYVDVETYDLEEAEAYREEINERYFKKREQKEPQRERRHRRRHKFI